MGGVGSFWAVLGICGFLSATWWASKLSRLVGVSSIVLEIATGVALGPRVLGLISEEYSECEHQRHVECRLPADWRRKLAEGTSLGLYLDTAARSEQCDASVHVAEPGDDRGADGGAGGNHSAGNRSASGPFSEGGGRERGTTTTPEVTTSAAMQTTTVRRIAPTPLSTTESTTAVLQATADDSTAILAAQANSSEDGNVTQEPNAMRASPSEDANTTSEESNSMRSSPSEDANITSEDTNTTRASVSEDANATSEDTTTTRANVSEDANATSEDSDAAPAGAAAAAGLAPAAVANASAEAGAALGNLSDGNGSELGAPAVEVPAGRAFVAGSSAGAGPPGRSLAGGGGGPRQESVEECLEKSCELEVKHQCSIKPDIFTLIGHTGVALMIFESGMHFDFAQAKDVGPSACIVAAVGTVLPVVVGTLVVVAFGKPLMPDGISAGAALAPTSVGIALRLLGDAGVLQESFGQAIITAAFVDDILSLLLFNFLFSLTGDFDPFATVVFPIVGIIFLMLAVCLAASCCPGCISRGLLALAPAARDGSAGLCARLRLTRDELLFFFMMCVLVAYALVTHLLGTHLWGCLVAGMTFACVQPAGHAHRVWVKQTKRFTTWMVRIFFACTVAFSIPVGEFLSVNAFWKGAVLGVFGCILTKVCCALLMEARWVIGWAMVGRAEFAYLIAQMAVSSNMLDEETFSIVIWALLCATVLAPIAFRIVLRRHVAQHGLEDLAEASQPLSDEGEREDEEHCQQEDPCGSQKVRDGACSDVPFEDLDDIKIECNPECEFLTEKCGEGHAKEATSGTSKLEDAADAIPAPAEKAVVADKKGRGKRARRSRSGKHIVFPGASPTNTRGFLCCLFFRRVVID